MSVDADVVDQIKELLEGEGHEVDGRSRHFPQMLLSPAFWKKVEGAIISQDLKTVVTGMTFMRYLKEKAPWVERVLLGNQVPEDATRYANAVLYKPFTLETTLASLKLLRRSDLS